jgi:hypothetical protein
MHRLLTSCHQKVAYKVLVLDITKCKARPSNRVRRNSVTANLDRSILLFGTKPQMIRHIHRFDMSAKRTHVSHSIKSDDHKDYLPSEASFKCGSTQQYSLSITFDERNQWQKLRYQRPSQRFVSNRSDQEWEQIHDEILQKNILDVMDVIDAEQCMRWWISQSRANLQKTMKDRTSFNRFKSKQRNEEENLTVSGTDPRINASKAIVSALDLFGHLVNAIEAQPELLTFDDSANLRTSDYSLNHWYDGYLPRATHLLNAILDAWRLCWINLDSDNKYVPIPQTIFTLLRDTWSDYVPMNETTYSIVMDAAVAKMSSLSNTASQQEVPIFCEEMIRFMLEKKVPKNISDQARPYYAEYSTLPDNVTYSTVLNAWARSGRTDAAERAEALFNEFTTFCSNGTLPTMPNTFCYNTVLVAMSTPPDSFVKQRRTLLIKAKAPDYRIDQRLADNVLRRENTLLLAEDMFRSMQHSPYPNVMPDTISFRTMIYAWSEYSVDLRYADREKSQNAIDRAVALLYEMAQLHVSSSNNAIDIDYSFFGKIISTLALNQPLVVDSFAKADFSRAEELYHYMLDLYRTTRDNRFTPDTSLLCAMTLVYAKDGRPLEAEAILTRLENEARSRNQVSMLPRISYYRGKSQNHVFHLYSSIFVLFGILLIGNCDVSPFLVNHSRYVECMLTIGSVGDGIWEARICSCCG